MNLPHMLFWVRSGSEHFLQSGQSAPQGGWRELSKLSHQTPAIDRTNLIKNYVPYPALEAAGYTERVRVTSGCERCHDKRPEVIVQFIGRDDDAGPGLLNFASPSRVETNQENIAASNAVSHYHCQSSSSKRVGVIGSSS